MFKGYNPLGGNGINTDNTDPVKKNATSEGTMTTGGPYGNVADRNLSPQFEKQRRKDLLASNLNSALQRLNNGEMSQSMYNQRVDTLNKAYNY